MDTSPPTLRVRMPEDGGRLGVVHALAPDEIRVFAHQVRPRGEPFEFAIITPKQEITVTGVVLDSRPVPDDYARGCRYELIVSMPDPPAEWTDLFKEMEKEYERRAEPRHQAALQVEFVEPPGLAPALTRNIAAGGAYVTRSEGLEVGMTCVVRVSVPGVPARLFAVGKVTRLEDDAVGLKFLELLQGEEALDAAMSTHATVGEPVFATPASDFPLRVEP